MRRVRPEDPLSPGLQAFAALRRHVPAETARDLCLDLVSLRVARALGRLGDGPIASGLAELPEALQPPRLSALDEAWEFLGRLPQPLLAPRLPGELYQRFLAEEAAEQEGPRRLGKRRMLGSFYTPEPIVERILDLAEAEGAEALLDPAMGSGHFLLAAAARFSGRLTAQTTLARLHGMDCDPVAVRLARRALWLALGVAPDPARIAARDALLDPLTGTFDCIVGNPPYDVLTHFDDNPAAREQAEAIRADGRYPLACRGQINLWRCFVELALRLLRPGGRLSFLVPATLLTDRVAAPLREAMLREHALDAIELLPEKSPEFPGIYQSLALFRCRKGAGSAGSVALASFAKLPRQVLLTQLERLGAELPIPTASEADWDLLDWLSVHATGRFGDLADASVGEVDQTVFRRFMLDRAEGRVPALLVRGCHLRAFALDLAPVDGPQRYLDREGFLRAKGEGAACLGRIGSPRIAQLGIRNLACLPRLLAAPVPAGVFLGNSLNAWIPRPGVLPGLVLGLLNSRLYDWRFRLTSGNNNINLREMTELPFPAAPESRLVREVAWAAEKCVRNAAAGRIVDRGPLDRAVERLFGIPSPLVKACGKRRSAAAADSAGRES